MSSTLVLSTDFQNSTKLKWYSIPNETSSGATINYPRLVVFHRQSGAFSCSSSVDYWKARLRESDVDRLLRIDFLATSFGDSRNHGNIILIHCFVYLNMKRRKVDIIISIFHPIAQ